ncbi:hypothetical protein GCM10017778_47870 [Streptomyces vinaceus]|nr:hypothetical protein GCM10017778_47870 [Streptomyces vinaceus]
MAGVPAAPDPAPAGDEADRGVVDAEAEADAVTVGDASGEAVADPVAEGSGDAEAAEAEEGAAEPTGSVEGPQAAVSPAATTAAATSGSRIPRGAPAPGGCVRRSARTGRSMRELMAKTPQDTDRNAGRADAPRFGETGGPTDDRGGSPVPKAARLRRA